MRYRWYVVAVLVLLGAGALVALHLKREAMALGIANDVLAGSGFSVSDLSIARLRPGEIRFSRLVLAQDDGTRYDLRDLHVPLDLPATRISRADIGRLIVTAAPGTGEPPRYAELLTLALDLPERYPGLAVTVGEIDWPGWPRLGNVEWTTQAASQRLAVELAPVRIEVATEATADGHRLSVAADGADAANRGLALRAELDVSPVAPGHRVTGTAQFGIGPWLAAAQGAGLVPATLNASGNGTASVGIDVGVTAPGTIAVVGTVHLDDGHRLGWDDGTGVRAVAAGLGSIGLKFGFPAGSQDWAVDTGGFDVAITHPAARSLDLEVASLGCRPGTCRLDLTLRAERAVLGDISVRRFVVPGTAEFAFGEDWMLTAKPASLRADELAGNGWRIGRVRLSEPRGLAVTLTPELLSARAERLTFDVEAAEAGDSLSGNARLRLEALTAGADPTTTMATMATMAIESRFELPRDALRLVWRGNALVPVALRGDIDYAGERGNVSVAAEDPARGLEARLSLALSAAEWTGTLDAATIGFDAAPLSASMTDWPYAWDIAAGRAGATGDFAWSPDDGSLSVDVRFELDDGGAAWGDIAATGIDAVAPVRIAGGNPPVVGPAAITAGLVDAGVALENVTTRFTWDTAGPVVDVASLAAGLLGGTLSAESFAFDLDNVSTALELEVDAVQLGLIPELAGFESLEVTGALSGTIPVAVENGSVTVTDGRLENVPPGGVIRYHAAPDGNGNSGFALAQRALSNLRYDRLTSDVSYTKTGDLVMKLRLEGTNPDMDPLQPVILNLTVENNIPQLLKSLQATRDIQDVIESRTTGKPARELPQ